jgi:hypothetical protein
MCTRRVFAGVVGGDAVVGTSTIGDEDDAAAMARAIGLSYG